MKKRPAAVESFADEMFIAEPSQTANGLFSFVEGLRHLNNPECRPWLEMCIAADQDRDFSPLLKLLQLAKPPTEVAPFLQNLFDRHGLLGKRGNLSRTPLYKDTRAETLLAIACESVEELKRDGMTVAKAIETATRWHAADGVTEEAVAAFKKLSGAMRRWKERVRLRRALG